jgi:arsenate reductase (thioredoxin)
MRTLLLLMGCLMTSTFAQNALAQNATRSTPPTGWDFTRALSFAQHFATPAALTPENDRQLKTTMLKALKEVPPTLSFAEVKEIFRQEEFAAWSPDDKLTVERMEELLRAQIPESRQKIFRETCWQVDLLRTQFDMIDGPHQRSANELAGWIAKNYTADKPLGVSVICTGNSRRSVMGAVMGNVAAAYWGLPNVKFHSGGTSPSACNARTIKALEEIGLKVASAGQEAPRGKAGDPNPIYQILWGERTGMQEFSKLYSHSENPQQDFAAILVCDEAEEACPTVPGASIRIAAPYFDPKAYDNTSLETSKYAERRDDIGRLMVCALMQARRQIQVNEKAR